MNDSLTRRSTVRELVAAFSATEATVRASFAAIVESERALNLAFGLRDYQEIRVSADRCYRSRFDDADAAIEHMARDAWSVIVDRLELRRAMSIVRYEELQKTIKDGPLPPITEESVCAFVARFSADLPTLFDEAVREVFDWLRPRHSKHKSNSEYEVPRKVVLGYVVEPRDKRWTPSTFRVCYHVAQKLIALENVFHCLDGRGQIAKQHHSELQIAIEACARDAGHGETDLFAFRVFDNGNAHFTFKRPDLLARFNTIAGGKRLRAA